MSRATFRFGPGFPNHLAVFVTSRVKAALSKFGYWLLSHFFRAKLISSCFQASVIQSLLLL